MKRLTYTLLILAAFMPFGVVAQSGISQLQQFTSTTSPAAITQTVFGKAFRLTGQTSGCAEFSANGTLTSTGVFCGSGGGGGPSFAYPFPSNATTTLLSLNGGASTTVFSSNYASSTLYYGASLATCQSGNFLTWAAGKFGCAADQIGGVGSFAYPFPSNATTTQLTFSGGIIGNVAGTASLATALAANGTNASAGNAILGVDASGNAEGAFDVWTEAENTAAAYINDGNTNWNNTYGFTTYSYPFPSNATSTSIAFNGGLTGTLTGSLIGNASTATALAANGTNCSAGSYARGVDASGNAENCTADADTTYTAGDALTLTGTDIDFDGGATPSGDIGGTWASLTVTDDSHNHTGATLSGIDISSDTNLAVTYPIILTGDTLSFPATSTLFGSGTQGQVLGWDGTKVAWVATSTCIQITGSADLCDGNDAAGGGGAAYPFAGAGNSTSTLTQFNGGLTSYGTTTIGAGATSTGLTINGGATTTSLVIAGLGTSTSIAGNVKIGGNLEVTGNVLYTGTGELIAVAVAAALVAIAGAAMTFTNKRITSRTGTTASSATPTINTDDVDYYSITALSTAITSFTTNLSGTPTDNQTLWISILDNGTARAITWGASFEASAAVALPTTTVISTRLDVGFVWRADGVNKWRCVAVT